jgi:transcriptional accessory protein Tex/SPT6
MKWIKPRSSAALITSGELTDILGELAKPGRDPRQKFEEFSFQSGVKKLEDLKPRMKLPGIVTKHAIVPRRWPASGRLRRV